ncbi:MAG: glycosyltransferase family 4 protein [Clostridia bacterium]|nr:glycosyltransferase family 4 protein [Clostridia bacterium]
MKIVFLVSNFGSGGAERTVAYLSNYISNKKDADVTVLSLGSDSFYSLDENVELVKFGIPSNCNSSFQKIRNSFFRFIKVRNYLRKHKPDVVFCMMAMSARFLPKRNKKFKLICSERSNPNYTIDAKRNKEKNKILKCSDGIIFQTERAKNCFPKEIADKGVVIQNAVGNPYVYQVSESPNRRMVISTMGRLSKEKDHVTLLTAFKIVLERYPDFILEIYGDGPYKQVIMDYSRELGVEDNVKFMGAREDAIVKISDSSCFVLSSIFEGMPNALMEAMAVGIPCVSTDCPFGPKELIEDGVNGLLVPVKDATSLANAIIKMISDKEFSQKCSLNAKKILQTNSIDNIAEQYFDFISKIVNR